MNEQNKKTDERILLKKKKKIVQSEMEKNRLSPTIDVKITEKKKKNYGKICISRDDLVVPGTALGTSTRDLHTYRYYRAGSS